MRPRRHFAEVNLVASDEQFHTEDAIAAEVLRHGVRDALRFLQRRVAHGLRLPRLAIIAGDLQMTDGRAEAGLAVVTHGEQRDLEIELDEAFDDDAPSAGAPALL